MNRLFQAQQYIQQHHLQMAYDLLNQLLQEHPDCAEALYWQGRILEYDRQYSAALDVYLHAVQLQPGNVEWNFALARVSALGVQSEEQILETLRIYSQLYLAYPEHKDDHQYQKMLLEKLGLWVFARQDEETASERLVNFPVQQLPTMESYFDFFNGLMSLKGNQKPQPLVLLRYYNDFIYRYPECEDRAFAYGNVATQFKSLGLYDLALSMFERAVALRQDLPPLIPMQFGMLLNLLGQYERGFPLVEKRWEQDLPGFNDVPFDFPRWRGEDLVGKRVLVVAEQGLGDAIQFIRYVPMLKAQGADVVVFNKPGVFNLMHDYLAYHGIEQRDLSDCHTGFDYFLPMMSLACYFKTTLETIPYSSGYLKLLPEFQQKWQTKLPTTEKMKIGFVFGGSKDHERNHERSIDVTLFSQLFALPAEFHCLQKEIDEQDIAYLAQYSNVFVHHQALNDFRDTAGLVEQLDLVISVDTSVAHLSAALGKPTWIMISYVPDFRWLLNREDSPWYDSVRLFRQYSDCAWQPVIQRIAEQLIQKVKE